MMLITDESSRPYLYSLETPIIRSLCIGRALLKTCSPFDCMQHKNHVDRKHLCESEEKVKRCVRPHEKTVCNTYVHPSQNNHDVCMVCVNTVLLPLSGPCAGKRALVLGPVSPAQGPRGWGKHLYYKNTLKCCLSIVRRK